MGKDKNKTQQSSFSNSKSSSVSSITKKGKPQTLAAEPPPRKPTKPSK